MAGRSRGEAMRKSKSRISMLLIAILLGSLVTWVQRYLRLEIPVRASIYRHRESMHFLTVKPNRPLFIGAIW